MSGSVQTICVWERGVSLSVLLVPLDQLVEPLPHGVVAKAVLGDGEGEHLAAALEGGVVDLLEVQEDFFRLGSVGEIALFLAVRNTSGNLVKGAALT